MKRLIRKIAEKIKLVDILSPDSIEDFGINTDYGNRASAIVFLDGEVVEGEIHREILSEMVDNIEGNGGFLDERELKEVNLPIALASKLIGVDGKVYISIYTDSVINTTLNEVKNAISSKFPGAVICKEDDRYLNNENSYIETI